ncbi:MAG: amidohydrolase [Sulfuritalea sp.]|nr:amidohydrolase [Sulfuritalea sp.]
MNEAGVWRTILSARNDRDPEDVEKLANEHTDRITAAVRSKGKSFIKNSPEFMNLISRQMSRPVFKAMAEVLLFHAQKGRKAPEINVAIDSPQARQLLDITIEKKWPFIAHYEFKAAGSEKSRFMEAFEATLRAHPTHPFALIHMGQLDAGEAGRLIGAHGNIHFLMSHSNPISRAEHPGQPWANLFDGDQLSDEWMAVILRHPERFVLAFDNVWPENWGRLYLEQAKLWRKTLSKLAPDVAHAIAHGNAERLWNLPAR